MPLEAGGRFILQTVPQFLRRPNVLQIFDRESIQSQQRGLYCFVVEDGEQIKYIGKTADSFKKRMNQGYGQIHPKNCYLDGQATNCHLNALIAGSQESVGLRVHPMEDKSEVGRVERLLIEQLRPQWNIQR